MRIFVHSATECFTDYKPHGEGLIFNDYLNALVDHGHVFEGYAGEVHLNCKIDGVTIHPLSINCIFRSFRYFKYNRAINRLFMKQVAEGERYDVVWRGNPMGEMCPVAPETSGLPLVVGPLYLNWSSKPQSSTPSKLGPSLIANRLAPLGWMKTLQKADLIFVTTASLKEGLDRDPAIQATVAIIPVMIDPPSHCLSQPKRPIFQLTWIGRLEDEKHPFLALDVVRELVNQGCSVTLNMIGDGVLRDGLHRYAAEHGISEQIEFSGSIPNSKVWDIAAESHVLLSTARDEPYGRAILEGMAVGAVPVVDRSGGAVEFITDGKSGVLCDEHSAQGYVKRILPLISSPELWQKMGEQAREVTHQFSSQVVAASMHSHLMALVNR